MGRLENTSRKILSQWQCGGTLSFSPNAEAS